MLGIVIKSAVIMFHEIILRFMLALKLITKFRHLVFEIHSAQQKSGFHFFVSCLNPHIVERNKTPFVFYSSFIMATFSFRNNQITTFLMDWNNKKYFWDKHCELPVSSSFWRCQTDNLFSWFIANTPSNLSEMLL